MELIHRKARHSGTKQATTAARECSFLRLTMDRLALPLYAARSHTVAALPDIHFLPQRNVGHPPCKQKALSRAKTLRSNPLAHLYGAPTLQQAEALLKREQRFFNIEAPGMVLKSCDMHHRQLAADAKLHPSA